MSVTLETLENLERKALLSVPMAEVDKEFEARLRQTARRARIDGFRPGKAPLNMVRSMYGASIQTDVLNELAQRKFFEVAQAEGWKIAGMPRLEGVENQDKDNFQFAGVFEVFPEITVGDLSGQEIEKIITQVSDAEVEKTIDILRQQRTRYNRVEREAKHGDRVIIDFEGKIDGVAFAGGSAQNYPFVLGQGSMLPEFEAGVMGLKEGESKDVEVNFPEDYHGKDVAGKTAVFTISLLNVAEPVLPEVDADFAKSLGIEDGDVAKMRDEVKKNVEREVKRRLDNKNKEAAMNALLAACPDVLVPNVLVAEEAERLAKDMEQNFINQGMTDVKQLNLTGEIFKPQAERRVKLGLIIAALVEAEKLEATKEQIDAVIADFADSYEDPQEVIDWYHADKSRLEGPSSLAVEANVMNFVLSKAKVTEKTVSFDEVMAG